MQKIILFLEKYKYWIFGTAILVAVGLRVWDFSGGMLLKGDQIRDAVMASRSLENGWGELPLLGPRAGGTKLRLGPIFYYFQAAAATMFDSVQPFVLALPNLLFSLLTIPLFFLFARLYFSQNKSLTLTGLFAFCFLAFEYSRFAWNPNSVPFFVLLFLYAWLKIFAAEKRLGWLWFALLGSAFAIASQLHFTSMVALGIFALVFLFLRYKEAWSKIGWQNLGIFAAVVTLFYVPVILSDILNKGDNLSLFFKSIGNKTSDHSAGQNIGKEFYYFGQYYFRIAFGYLGSLKALHYLGAVLLTLGVAFNVSLWRKEKEKQKKDFLLTVLIWTVAFVLLYFPLAYEIDKPRFFLPLIFLPYLHLGFLWQWQIEQRFLQKVVVAFLLGAMLLGNLVASVLWLQEFARAQKGKLNARNTVILKAKKDAAWWSWGMIEKASRMMSENCQGGAVYYFLPKQSVEFADTFDWAFKVNGEKREFGFVKKINAERRGCIFAATKQSYNLEEALADKFAKIGNAGDIAVYKLARKEEDEQVEKKEEKTELPVAEEFTGSNHQRAYWKDIRSIFNF